MPDKNNKRKVIILLLSAFLMNCGDDEVVSSRQSIDIQNLKQNKVAEEQAEPVDKPLIYVSDGELSIKLSLDGTKTEHSKLARFVRTRQRQPVDVLETSAYIRTGINSGAILSIKMELLYQSKLVLRSELYRT